MTAKHRQEEHVLPRPVGPLPDYALARARNTAAEKLTEVFGLSAEAAACVADAVVDPAELRKSIEHPLRTAVPGGTLIALRTELWTRKVLPDPRNPRLGPKRRHPFAVEPGTDEESRFAPVPDPTSDGVKPELHVGVESREHLTWASVQAKIHVLDMNDWRTSIRSQGVMTAVQVVATEYQYSDGAPALWAITTAEGSSRVTATHDILGVVSVDSVYDSTDRVLRAHIKRVNEALERGNAQPKDYEQLRCERIPAEFIVGFEPHRGVSNDFATAVKSLVALRHVDPPREWGEGPENESLADGCLFELERRGLITNLKRRWLAAAITRAQAEASHLSADPAIRAAEIVRVFTHDDAEHRDALRTAVTAQSTRKRISPKLLIRLAAALIVRGISEDTAKMDRSRRYLQDGYGDAVRDNDWKPTQRSADELLTAALDEHREDPAPSNSPLGPHRLELAARSALPLIAKGVLFGDRGTTSNNQPDRRSPGQVIDRMVREEKGICQLHRALIDFAGGEPIRVVDEAGNVVRGTDGQDQKVNDHYLRATFSPAGQVHAPTSVVTADQELEAALAHFGNAVVALVAAMDKVQSVVGAGGESLVEEKGVTTLHTNEWRNRLRSVDDQVSLWGATYSRKHRSLGTQPSHLRRGEGDDSVNAEDEDEDEDARDDSGEEFEADAVAGS
ncbi:hypothetical protein SOCEGT47_045800 [Sorangium cellulosum]|uniref:Uncharacterized protein n=1 Tax=Sorangium cellulosum TaxID=56 RepID=A0A4P2Q3X3_SORCE|nr:hypothetical protein [Sorangium cellulosum]AUX24047.1 hypothetical protein SOCEGT47_045800 [Sorangium cellulosum]